MRKIDVQKREKIKRLIRTTTLSNSKISSEVGVGKNTAARIRQKLIESGVLDRSIGSYENEKGNVLSHRKIGKHQRCPGCGGLVLMPCLKCKITGGE